MEALQKQQSLPLLVFALLPFFLLPASSLVQGEDQSHFDCPPFLHSCGGVDKFNISYPFWTKGYPHNCSQPEKEFEITCNQKDNSSEIEIESRKYHVEMIDYESQTLTIVDKAFFGPDVNLCDLSSLKNNSTPVFFEFFSYYPEQPKGNNEDYPNLIFLHICPFYKEDYPGFRFSHCPSNNATGSRAYFTLQPEIDKFGGCKVVEIPISTAYRDWLKKAPHAEAAWKAALENGLQITWSPIDPGNVCGKCIQSKAYCGHSNSTPRQSICYCGGDGQPNPYTCPPQGSNKNKHKRVTIGAAVIGAGIVMTCFLVLMVLLMRKLPSDNSMFFWKKKTYETHNVEAFLENHASLVPKRYRYSKLKKITNSFKDNLGQGGCGSVFKGKLNDGPLVAVKVLNKSKGGNGEEFTNEVSSISRTRHVNVVALLGFCSEGSKRALVYKFMSNGSLDKFIYSKKQGIRNSLDCQKLLDIALGIARGLEYLHRGCDTRILHLDIKPHNILLDDNFCPKISDFGLAKLCPGQQSTISMLDARGTVGFIAPEVFCRSIGGVSHKSDVYSYGMMVLEMIGGRKNIDARVDNTSEIYFPDWAHKHINIQGSQVLFGFRTEEEEEIARKMVMVGLWCIQTNPANRPSMNRVVEMLEGSLGSLEMPPKPYLSSPSRPCSSTT